METRQLDPTRDLSGQTIRGYTLKDLIGSGQLTAVYRVRKEGETSARILTIIVPPPTLSESARERFLLRFDQEAARLLSLKHPHILPLEGWGQQAGYPYLLMPELQGRPLAAVLQSYGRCSPAYAVAVLERVADTLEYAHKHGVLHLSLSPARIFLHQDLFIQVTGFGLVRLVERSGIEEISSDPYRALKTVAGTYFESPEYLAPEIVQGQRPDARADVYALGILLYEMLCGHPPFTGNDYLDIALKHVKQPLPSLHSSCPDIPLAMELAIHQALKRDPNQRFQRPQDLANACLRVLTRRSFALVSLNREVEETASAQKVEREQLPAIVKHKNEDLKELDQDLLRIWQATKSRRSYLQELHSHLSDQTSKGSPSEHLTSLSPHHAGISFSGGTKQLGTEKNVALSPSNERQSEKQSHSSRVSNLQSTKGLSAPPPLADQQHVTDLLAALENLPRPTYGAESDARLLVPVPEPISSNGPGSLRSSLENIVNGLLPALPLTPIQRRRQKFIQMFPQP